ncbi:MAG: TRAM domain-containing protein, partial [Synergistes sp.]|nr:TRAM domain-containing protein [Synergistes sp.]
MRQGDIIKATITEVNNEGEGVVRVGEERFVLFVPNALPGEETELRVVTKKNRYGVAKLLKRFNDSPERIEPVCKSFGHCGGCALQHMDYDAQLRLKRKSVTDAL